MVTFRDPRNIPPTMSWEVIVGHSRKHWLIDDDDRRYIRYTPSSDHQQFCSSAEADRLAAIARARDTQAVVYVGNGWRIIAINATNNVLGFHARI